MENLFFFEKNKTKNNLLRRLYGSRLLNSKLQRQRLYQSVIFSRNGVVKAYIIIQHFVFEGIYSSCFLGGFPFKSLWYYLAAEPYETNFIWSVI